MSTTNNKQNLSVKLKKYPPGSCVLLLCDLHAFVPSLAMKCLYVPFWGLKTYLNPSSPKVLISYASTKCYLYCDFSSLYTDASRETLSIKSKLLNI